MDRQALIRSTERFPTSPGIYIMKDSRGRVLYIGKSSNLKSRVRSYFSDDHADRPHIIPMLDRLDTIEWIATRNEAEALILEANLIRSHKPPYNVDLKDDKHYPYLKVTVNEPFPRLVVARRVLNDGARYFGPYTDARSMRRLMSYAKRIFKVRDCRKHLPLAHPIRPCLNYSIGRCSGACGGKIDQAEYRENVERLMQFLRGKRNDLLVELEQRMQEAAETLQYERAASYRDQIRLIRDASRSQKVDLAAPEGSYDLFGVHEGERHVCLAVLHFREGVLLSSRHFVIERSAWELSTSNHDAAIVQFYLESTHELPQEVLVSESAGIEPAMLQAWFDARDERRVTVHVPRRGNKKRLVELAEKNARLYLVQNVPYHDEDAVQDLQQALHLPFAPNVIEAFDISNLGEAFAVAGMVQFVGGAPRKANYRRFKIGTVAGQDDFAMLMEAVTRRLSRLQAEGRDMPDLLLIDGGKGQLSAVTKALGQFERPPMVASLAKKEEVLYSPFVDGEVRLSATHPARRLVERVRDEVHRYAVSYHRKLRGGQFRRSALEEIPGIGPKTARALLRRFGSIKRLRESSVDDIAAVKGITPESAARLKSVLEPVEQR